MGPDEGRSKIKLGLCHDSHGKMASPEGRVSRSVGRSHKMRTRVSAGLLTE